MSVTHTSQFLLIPDEKTKKILDSHNFRSDQLLVLHPSLFDPISILHHAMQVDSASCTLQSAK